MHTTATAVLTTYLPPSWYNDENGATEFFSLRLDGHARPRSFPVKLARRFFALLQQRPNRTSVSIVVVHRVIYIYIFDGHDNNKNLYCVRLYACTCLRVPTLDFWHISARVRIHSCPENRVMFRWSYIYIYIYTDREEYCYYCRRHRDTKTASTKAARRPGHEFLSRSSQTVFPVPVQQIRIP